MKRILVSALLLLFLLPLPTASAHPGRTDGSGGHTDRSTGEYHYHHGYSAHQHTDLDGDGKKDCPYNFKDKTGSSCGSSTSGSKSKNASDTQKTSLANRPVNKALGILMVLFMIFSPLISRALIEIHYKITTFFDK